MDEIVKSSGLLPDREYEAVEKLHSGIRHDFEVKPVFRTETECRISVLSDVHFPTPHMKYWQSVREQQVHFEELVWLDFNYQELKLDIEELEEKLSTVKGIEQKRLVLKLKKKRYELMLCEKVGKERVREIKQWGRIKDELVKQYPTEVFVDNADAEVAQLKGYTKTFILEMLHSGHNIAASDAQNIFGKPKTAIRRCKEIGVWDEVVEEMNLNDAQLQTIHNVLGE